MAEPDFESTWASCNLDDYRVTMEDGFVEIVKSKSEFLVMMQCTHYRLTEHGPPIDAEKVDDVEEPPRGIVIKKVSETEQTLTAMQKSIKEKAENLLMAHGLKTAKLICLEMELEYSCFPNGGRGEFWRAVSEQIEKLSA